MRCLTWPGMPAADTGGGVGFVGLPSRFLAGLVQDSRLFNRCCFPTHTTKEFRNMALTVLRPEQSLEQTLAQH